jgi:hypothetical protein
VAAREGGDGTRSRLRHRAACRHTATQGRTHSDVQHGTITSLRAHSAVKALA